MQGRIQSDVQEGLRENAQMDRSKWKNTESWPPINKAIAWAAWLCLLLLLWGHLRFQDEFPG
ncbi:MAG: hypothetical protein DMG40_05600 [Acidobacteria bacterium]|nr:MAG: hypothetical protein DMG40_05600 [Acidobacteriota bacterium]